MNWKWWNCYEFKTPSTDSNLGPRFEGSGETKDLPTLGPRIEVRKETRNVGKEKYRWEEFCDFEPCIKTKFGTSVNALPNFSTKMGEEKKTALRTSLVSAQLKGASTKS
ncbi:hypothetical protein AVEN_228080-1 [Araneus ventricosus]|uniref:Uncharacterized protein n=1 Tax=Araneus ventricosus TaxID=182803 RepID=A0A4Y2F756_ARAVE|nr:hypothetical protein AVEN_228080-1 [Araneus ventricosus]